MIQPLYANGSAFVGSSVGRRLVVRRAHRRGPVARAGTGPGEPGLGVRSGASPRRPRARASRPLAEVWLASLRVAGDRVAREPGAERERHRRRRDHGEHDEPADHEHPVPARGRRQSSGRGAGRPCPSLHRPDGDRGAGGVVVVEPLVRLVVDVAGGALGLEVVERAQQELALLLLCASSSSLGHCRARSSRDELLVGLGRRPAAVGAPAAEREHDPARAEHERGDRQRPHQHADAPARRLEQHRLAVPVDVHLPDLRVALTVADARLRCRPAVAAAVDVALSATERLSQSTQRSSRRDPARVRATVESSVPRGHAAYASTPTTSTPSTIQGNHRRTTGLARPLRVRHHLVEDLRRHRAELGCDDQPVGTDRVRLRLAAGAEVQRGLATRVERDRPRRPSRRSRSCGSPSCVSSRTMPTHHDARVVCVLRVPGHERVVLLATRDAPRVPEVHDHRLAREVSDG